jgi:hypothetical protein
MYLISTIGKTGILRKAGKVSFEFLVLSFELKRKK